MESQVLFSTSDYKAPGVEGPVDGPVGLTETGRTVDLSGVDVGVVVKVKGGMGVFRGEKQVMLERICMSLTFSFGRPSSLLLPSDSSYSVTNRSIPVCLSIRLPIHHPPPSKPPH